MLLASFAAHLALVASDCSTPRVHDNDCSNCLMTGRAISISGECMLPGSCPQEEGAEPTCWDGSQADGLGLVDEAIACATKLERRQSLPHHENTKARSEEAKYPADRKLADKISLCAMSMSMAALIAALLAVRARYRARQQLVPPLGMQTPAAAV